MPVTDQPLLIIDDLIGNQRTVLAHETVVLGRKGDFIVGEDDKSLHRSLLRFWESKGLWLVSNVGSRIPVTVEPNLKGSYAMQQIGPGAMVAMAPGRSTVTFTTPERMYELEVTTVGTVERKPDLIPSKLDADLTSQDIPLRDEQIELLRALVAPLQSRFGMSLNDVPTVGALAETLGWSRKKAENKIERLSAMLAEKGIREFRTNAQGKVPKRLLLASYAQGRWDIRRM